MPGRIASVAWHRTEFQPINTGAAEIPLMAVTSIAEFLALLQQVPLLDPTRLEQLIDHPGRFADLPGLTRELVRRGWLTAFQVEYLLQGNGASLIVGPYVLLERVG